MKIAVLLFAVLALATAAKVPKEYLEDLRSDGLEDEYDVSRRDLPSSEIQVRSLTSKAEKAIRDAIDQFSTGWPEAGIPPIAPFESDEFVLEMKKSFAEIFAKFEDLRIEGLDDVQINHLLVKYVFKQNIDYNFTFPEITITGKYMTDSQLNLMEEYGISARVYGKGDFELVLENLSFQGHFKYDFPLIYGSIKVHDFDGIVSLGNIQSRINGLLGGKYYEVVNENIEKAALNYIRSNQDELRTMTEDLLIPLVNTKFNGKNIWSFVG